MYVRLTIDQFDARIQLQFVQMVTIKRLVNIDPCYELFGLNECVGFRINTFHSFKQLASSVMSCIRRGHTILQLHCGKH